MLEYCLGQLDSKDKGVDSTASLALKTLHLPEALKSSSRRPVDAKESRNNVGAGADVNVGAILPLEARTYLQTHYP